MLPDWILPSALRGVTWKSLEATRLKACVFTLEYRPAINDEATLQRLQCRIVDLASDARPAIHNFSTFYFRILDPVYVHLHTVVMDATPEASCDSSSPRACVRASSTRNSAPRLRS